jgi:methyl-accepting chemotaxis protein
MRTGISIAAKLGLCLVTLVLLIVATCALSLAELRRIDAAAARLRDARIPTTDSLGRIGINFMRQRVNAGRLITADTPALRSEVTGQIASRDTLIAAQLTRYEALPLTPPEREAYATFRQHVAAYYDQQREALARAGAGDVAGGQRIYNTTMSDSIRTIMGDWETLIALNDAESQASGALIAQTYAAANRNMLTLAGLAGVIGLGAFVLVAGGVSRPLRRIAAATQRLAAGDAEVTIPGRARRDEIGALAGSVVVFRDNLIRNRILETEAARVRADAETQRRAATHAVADAFEKAVGGIVGSVTAASTELEATARSLTGSAAVSASQSATVSTAAGEAATNVSTVAAAAEDRWTWRGQR